MKRKCETTLARNGNKGSPDRDALQGSMFSAHLVFYLDISNLMRSIVNNFIETLLYTLVEDGN